jgi:flagellar biosynthesis GTPase FlhF
MVNKYLNKNKTFRKHRSVNTRNKRKSRKMKRKTMNKINKKPRKVNNKSRNMKRKTMRPKTTKRKTVKRRMNKKGGGEIPGAPMKPNSRYSASLQLLLEQVDTEPIEASVKRLVYYLLSDSSELHQLKMNNIQEKQKLFKNIIMDELSTHPDSEQKNVLKHMIQLFMGRQGIERVKMAVQMFNDMDDTHAVTLTDEQMTQLSNLLTVGDNVPDSRLEVIPFELGKV